MLDSAARKKPSGKRGSSEKHSRKVRFSMGNMCLDGIYIVYVKAYGIARKSKWKYRFWI